MNKINKIENLSLIEKNINSRFGNNSFNKKIEIYEKEFIKEKQNSKIDSINEIFLNKNKDKLSEILENRRNKQINFASQFVEAIKEKFEKTFQ